MNWLTNFIRPKIRSIVEAKEIPDNLWQKCPSCEGMLFHRDLAEAMNVCYHCGHHMKVPVKQRLQSLFDEGSWKEITVPRVPFDPLKFKDRKRYADRLKETRVKTGREDAILVAKGTMDGLPVVIAAFDFDFMGGSMGAAVGEGLVVAAEHAVKTGAALIAIPASGGARMQEGAISLMQMPRTIIAANMVKDAGLPYLVLLTDPTTGGVSASFAMVGDIHIAEPGCMIGFAGKRVIQETIREELPPNFQTAEYLQEHGMVDLVVPRKELRATLIRLLDLSMRKMRDPRQRLGGGDGDNAGGKGGRVAGKSGGGIKAKITRAKTGAKPANVNSASRKKKAA
ncbi:MAG: acetyl-CoA carboxylase carboxyltransferase subunit beta [Micavibrio aeruginosavorus]|uniref:Acetyl-coenzyme A carboxylase carboxyl transferase subunit beta n=1 Tax=Micavibrio aeruginosavorus TaxID=349221 RepID=A0A7T5UHR6_9BACT|nr:MAG: acetyl-CoA carboxylase carboxyltransferase subunit beta [Micavibrio aeruginosavorus]